MWVVELGVINVLEMSLRVRPGLGRWGSPRMSMWPLTHTHPPASPWVDESRSHLPAPPDLRHAASLLDKEVLILHPSFLLSFCPVPKMPSEP